MARILGIDIQPNAIHATLVRSTFRNLEVLRYLELPRRPSHAAPAVPAPVVVHEGEGEEAQNVEGQDPPAPRPPVIESELAATVRALIESISPPPDQVVVAMDGREASIRSVNLPLGAAKRIAEVLPFELDEKIPFDVAETLVDFQEIRRGEATLDVLACAVPKSEVRAKLSELKDAGLDPVEIAIGAAALDGLVHTMPELTGEGPHLVIDVQAERTDVCVLENGKCAFARTLGAGIAGYEDGSLGPLLKRTMASYRASGGFTPVSARICGWLATDESAAVWLGSVLRVEASVAQLPEAPGTTPERRPIFGHATALACRGAGKGRRLNLRRGEFAHARARGATRQYLRLAAIGATPVLLAFFFAIWARYSVLSDEREALRTELAEVTGRVFDHETRSAAEARELLVGGRRVADPLPNFTAYDVLDAISAAVPADITHDTRRLTIEIDDQAREGNFEIQGIVASIAERDAIAANFESHECFNEIRPGPVSPGPGNEGVNYRLEATVHCPGDEPIETEESSSRGRRGRRGR